MNDAARSRYFGHYWPVAAVGKGWRVKDEIRRRHTTGECMRLIRAPISESTTDLGPDEVTALFIYLDHLGHPADLLKAAAWVDVQTDYKAYNRARQADWYERKTYGHKGSGKLRKNRFGGQKKAAGEPLEPFDPAAINKRFMTMKNRYRTKQKKQQPGDMRFVAEIAGRVVTGPAPVSVHAPVNRVAAHAGRDDDNQNPF